MARVVVAEDNGALIGFVTVDPETMYLDQIVVATEYWGGKVALTLLDEAKRISPQGARTPGQQGQCPRHPLLREARI